MKSILNEAVLSLILLMVIGIVLSGCSDEIGTGPSKKEYANIFMPQARQNPANHSVKFTSKTQTIVYGAVYGGADRPQIDIPVHFNVDPSLVNRFNSSHGTSYGILPKVSYELAKKTATIPAGYVSTPALHINLHTLGNINSDTPYLLPITLEVDNTEIPVNKKLQTTYFLIQGSLIKYDRSDWKILDVDSQSSTFPASNILDDNTSSFWLTQYTPTAPPFPHHVSVDMGKKYAVSKFKLLGRSGFKLSNPKDITIEFSSDGEKWRNSEDFTLPFDEENINASILLSDPVEARYFKIIIHDAVDSTIPPFTNLAEVYVY